MKVEWSRAARSDLDAFADQAATTDPDRADRLLAAASEASDFLSRVPRGGSPIGADSIRKLTLRPLPFLLLYVVRPDMVEVLRLHHARSNWRPA